MVANAVALLNPERGSGGIISEVALQSNPTEAAPLVGLCHPLREAGIISQGPHGSYSHLGPMEYAFDLSVDIGMPVYAMRSGKVLNLEDRFPDTGGGEENLHKFNYVLIEHTNEYRSAYLHLEQGFQARIGIKLGDRVQAGQLISYSGNSGWSTGPHLRIEIHYAAPKGSFGQTAPFQIDRICGSGVIALAQVERRLANRQTKWLNSVLAHLVRQC
ncbi:Phage tail tape measure protein [uncultured Synechococcales cyanobacterium]|uniref:Phage tail tape measure protein n=1 Tax=uncultured Synechococcales cyanobacterium TaxID=1936017 RepID=A0A6J4UHX9_9CYAN|nr:Phage tail tape measure protein [uncultured Synechococcales cyanobacterium]